MAAFIGTMSGGGAGLIALFALLSLGMPINQAIATNKFGDLGFFPPAVRNFGKAKQIKKKALPAIITINIIGVALGTLAITHLNLNILRKFIAVILVLVVITNLLKNNYATTERPARWYWPFIFFGTSIAQGTVGAGTGLLSTMTLMYFRGFTALQSMANWFLANMFGTTLSLGILVFGSSLINYRYGFFLLVGNLIGAHFGSKIAIKRGNGFVRIMIMLLAILVVFQLIFIKN
jgi:uncharacterized membrane protein YfcA